MMFIAFQATFIPMFQVGVKGMNRRVAEYPDTFAGYNQLISIAAFVLGASFIVFVVNMVFSWFRGPVAEANPWHSRTLEWQTSSPPPLHDFEGVPVITGSPYDYGVPGAAPHVRLDVAPTAGDGS